MRNYPQARRGNDADVCFGRTIPDPYRWLEDPASAETLALVEAENAYTKAFFDAQPVFRADERERALRERPQPNRFSEITEIEGGYCASRALPGGLHEVVRLDAEWKVAETIANDATFGNRMHVFSARPCPTHSGVYALLAVKHGAPRCCVIVYNAVENEVLGELDGTFDFSWSEDGEAILYSDAEVDAANNRNINYIRRYVWQQRRLETLHVCEENAVFVKVVPAPRGGMFFCVLRTYDDVLVLYRSAEGALTRLNDGVGNCGYLGTGDGKCFFLTNANAPMGQVIALPVDKLEQEGALQQASAVALAQTDALLSGVCVLPDGLLAVHERDAVSEMALYTFTGERVRALELPSRYGYISCHEQMELSPSGRVYASFESFTRESSPLVYDHAAGTLSLMGNPQDDSDIAVEQCFLNARDGQRILVYLVRPKDLTPRGDTPVLMYGYGGYASSSNPWSVDMVTEQNIAEWVRMGRIYAHCVIRGGSEYGAAWHEGAMLNRKKNAFFDFIDIAEYLIQEGWTKPSRLIATGLSNGGLLMTAIATLRPDLFGVVVASVPHTDMLRFRNDPRGMMYITEYGDPLSSEEMFEYMASYSPYHNIKPGVLYPRMYIQTGEMDNNVPPYHGKKFAVRLQHEADERHPVLLQVLAHGSHNRGTGDEYYLNVAQAQTFIEICLAETEE